MAGPKVSFIQSRWIYTHQWSTMYATSPLQSEIVVLLVISAMEMCPSVLLSLVPLPCMSALMGTSWNHLRTHPGIDAAKQMRPGSDQIPDVTVSAQIRIKS